MECVVEIIITVKMCRIYEDQGGITREKGCDIHPGRNDDLNYTVVVVIGIGLRNI